LRLHYKDPSLNSPPVTDIANILLYECLTDTDTDAGTLVGTLPFVPMQGYIDYGAAISGRFYRIKFKDVNGLLSIYPSAPALFSTATDATCLVFDTLIDLKNVPQAGVPIKIILNRPDARYNGRSIGQNTITLTTDDKGMWDSQLIPNSLIVPAGTKYVFNVNGKSFERVVPPLTSQRFSNLK
jgi:hypothetical protein